MYTSSLNMNLTVNVLVKGKPIATYAHNQQTYLEGRSRSEFEIELVSRSSARTLAVVSVDGLSVLDGQVASEHSPGYLLNPYQTLRIPGWTLSASQVAKFVFGSRKNSYAQLGGQGETNCGVIGVIWWGEKVHQSPYYRSMTQPAIYPPYSNTDTFGGSFHGSLLNSSGLQNSVVLKSVVGNASTQTTNATLNAQSASVNNLGTGFGGAENFSTKQVSFEKGNIISTTVLYYDDAKGLKARGIEILPAVSSRIQVDPNPFPAMGCKPPPGWTK